MSPQPRTREIISQRSIDDVSRCPTETDRIMVEQSDQDGTFCPLLLAQGARRGRQEDAMSEEQELVSCLSDESFHEAKAQQHEAPARRYVQNLGGAALSLLVGMLPLYFIVFAILANGNDSREILAGSQAKWLLEAAKYVCRPFRTANV